jgi:hypothetical protein
VPIDTGCDHRPVSPGQMCGCLHMLIELRLTVELLCKRIVELERAAQHHPPTTILNGGSTQPAAVE